MIHSPSPTVAGRMTMGLLLMTGLLFSNAAAQDPSLIVNGSFEQGPAPGSYLHLDGGATSITGWVVTGEGVDYIGRLWTASDGGRSLDLDGSKRSAGTPPYAQGGIAQTFATTPGTRYLVNLDLAGNPFGGLAVKPMRVSAAGQHMDFTFDITGKNGSNMGWTSKSWTFTANSASTTLEFRSLTVSPATGWGPAIDNVSVTVVNSPPHLDVHTDQEQFPVRLNATTEF